MTGEDVELSKLVAWMLRHDPAGAGIAVDDAGWAAVSDVVAACRARGHAIDEGDLVALVVASGKARYALDAAQRRIRAQQGHSFPVALGYVPARPPPRLYHGTVARFIAAIEREGLLPKQRHDVHLSEDVATALEVGRRRGDPVVLEVDAAAMHADGHVFSCTPNGVWLVAAVPPGFLRRLPSPPAPAR